MFSQLTIDPNMPSSGLVALSPIKSQWGWNLGGWGSVFILLQRGGDWGWGYIHISATTTLQRSRAQWGLCWVEKAQRTRKIWSGKCRKVLNIESVWMCNWCAHVFVSSLFLILVVQQNINTNFDSIEAVETVGLLERLNCYNSLWRMFWSCSTWTLRESRSSWRSRKYMSRYKRSMQLLKRWVSLAKLVPTALVQKHVSKRSCSPLYAIFVISSFHFHTGSYWDNSFGRGAWEAKAWLQSSGNKQRIKKLNRNHFELI